MHTEEIILLLSIKPRFAEAILDGTKTVELRRVQPSVRTGAMVLLYASSPQRELVGTFRVAGLEVGSSSAIWDRHGSECGVSQAEFIDYFAGANQAVAILVDSPVRLSQPQSLRDPPGSDGRVPPSSKLQVLQPSGSGETWPVMLAIASRCFWSG